MKVCVGVGIEQLNGKMANQERVKTGNKRSFDVAFLSGSDDRKFGNGKDESRRVNPVERSLKVDKPEVRVIK